MAAMTGNGPSSPFRATSAWVPVALAGGAIALLAGTLLTGPHAPNIVVENGVPREDEGAVAHLWQLLMLLQVPCVLFFAAWWLPKDPKRALAMLGIQGFAFVAAALPVWLLEL
jgi:hypothetical protein